MKKLILCLSAIALCIVSCNEDFEDESTKLHTNSNIELKDGRLFFSNKVFLQNLIEEYKNKSEDELYNYMKKYYDAGFLSLKAPVTEKNEGEIKKQYDIRIEKYLNSVALKSNRTENSNENYYDNIDEIEEIIGSELYAAFLNDQAEIQIADSIYKYTDAGLFISKASNYSDINTYLIQKNISTNMIDRTNETTLNNFFIENQVSTITNLSPTVSYYRTNSSIHITSIVSDTPSNDEFLNNIGGGGYSGGGGSSGGNNTVDHLVGIKEFVETRQLCSPNSGFLGSIFGDNKICYDRYETRRRVRTKAFRHDYLVAYHLGCSVKHQFRGWTYIWRTESTAVTGMAVEFVQFEYDFQHIYAPHISTNPQRVKYTTNKTNFQYTVNTDIWQSRFGTFSHTFVNSTNYPISNFHPIVKDDLVIEADGSFSLINQGLSQVNRQLTSDKLNDYFWNHVWKTAKWGLGQLASPGPTHNFDMPKNMTLVSQHPSLGKIMIQKSHFTYGLNMGECHKTFDWGASLGLNISSSGSQTNFNYSGGPGSHILMPKSFKIRIVGFAKNQVWRGSKLEI